MRAPNTNGVSRKVCVTATFHSFWNWRACHNRLLRVLDRSEVVLDRSEKQVNFLFILSIRNQPGLIFILVHSANVAA